MAGMYAILETGGKQYKVQPGDEIEVERIDGEVGSRIELGQVLMTAGDGGQAPRMGSPLVDGVTVAAEVIGQGKGRKIIVFKYRNKVRYRRKTGHRQMVTRLRITGIGGSAGDEE